MDKCSVKELAEIIEQAETLNERLAALNADECRGALGEILYTLWKAERAACTRLAMRWEAENGPPRRRGQEKP